MRKDKVLESITFQHEWQEGNDEQTEKHPAVIHHMPLLPVQ